MRCLVVTAVFLGCVGCGAPQSNNAPFPGALWGASSDDLWFSVDRGDEWGTKAATLYHWDGSQVTEYSALNMHNINKIWGRDDGTAWAVGTDFTGHGVMLSWDRGQWNSAPTPNAASYNSLTGLPSGEMWLAGDFSAPLLAFGSSSDYNGILAHWDGAAWGPSFYPVNTSFADVTAISATQALAVDRGQAAVWLWDGESWSNLQLTDGIARVCLVGTNDAWMITGLGLGRWDGTSVTLDSTLHSALLDLRCGPGGRVWVEDNSQAATQGPIRLLERDGGTWSEAAELPAVPAALWAFNAQDIWAFGLVDGPISLTLQHWDGTAWTPVFTPQ